MRLGQDLVEEILERLPAKSLLRFKSVSKQLKLMIESKHFEKKHLEHWESQEPDFFLIDVQDELIVFSTLVVDSVSDQDLKPEREFALKLSPYDHAASKICDGLICIYDFCKHILVVNPSTKWMREVPPARFQLCPFDTQSDYEDSLLGFGKDIWTGTYKLVWLYNSSESILSTTCEVFDFNTNTWRYVESSPYRILGYQNPTYVDGSLHWFIFVSYTELNILSFDCHTETFQVFPKPPVTGEDETRIIMCNMNNRLCVSEKKWPTQDIWTLNSSNMTWEKIFSLDLSSCPDITKNAMYKAGPLTILKKTKKALWLFDGSNVNQNLVIYDLETRSCS